MTMSALPVGLAEVSQQLSLPKVDSSQTLAQRFEQVLAQTPPETQTHAAANNAASSVGQALASFDRHYLEANSNLQQLTQQASSMDQQVFAATSMQVMQQMGMSQAYFQLGNSLVASGKSTLTTLLKSA